MTQKTLFSALALSLLIGSSYPVLASHKDEQQVGASSMPARAVPASAAEPSLPVPVASPSVLRAGIPEPEIMSLEEFQKSGLEQEAAAAKVSSRPAAAAWPETEDSQIVRETQMSEKKRLDKERAESDFNRAIKTTEVLEDAERSKMESSDNELAREYARIRALIQKRKEKGLPVVEAYEELQRAGNALDSAAAKVAREANPEAYAEYDRAELALEKIVREEKEGEYTKTRSMLEDLRREKDIAENALLEARRKVYETEREKLDAKKIKDDKARKLLLLVIEATDEVLKPENRGEGAEAEEYTRETAAYLQILSEERKNSSSLQKASLRETEAYERHEAAKKKFLAPRKERLTQEIEKKLAIELAKDNVTKLESLWEKAKDEEKVALSTWEAINKKYVMLKQEKTKQEKNLSDLRKAKRAAEREQAEEERKAEREREKEKGAGDDWGEGDWEE